MKLKTIIYILFSLLLLTACVNREEPNNDNNQQEENSNEKDDIVFYPPVEIKPANTTYSPAFINQTRVSGIKTTTDYAITIITDQLNSPWGIEQLPSGDLIVTEKEGTLKIVSLDQTIQDVLFPFDTINSSGQGGLLDVAVSPDFSQSRLLAFTLSEQTASGQTTAVATGLLSQDQSEILDFQIIYRALPYFSGVGHYGSRVIFDEDGHLFVSTGDRQSMQTRHFVQSLSNGLGKILHMTIDGQPLPSNPYSGEEGADEAIFALGLRNVQGLAIHPINKSLWASEMGPQGGDELNLIESGKNYGWPIISYGLEYNGQPIGEGITQKDGLEQPVYYWDPAVAPSGMVFYASDVIKEWQNNLFVGALRGQHIIRLMIENNRVIGEERLLTEENQRFRDLATGLDGSLFAITDAGRLYRISKP